MKLHAHFLESHPWINHMSPASRDLLDQHLAKLLRDWEDCTKLPREVQKLLAVTLPVAVTDFDDPADPTILPAPVPLQVATPRPPKAKAEPKPKPKQPRQSKKGKAAKPAPEMGLIFKLDGTRSGKSFNKELRAASKRPVSPKARIPKPSQKPRVAGKGR